MPDGRFSVGRVWLSSTRPRCCSSCSVSNQLGLGRPENTFNVTREVTEPSLGALREAHHTLVNSILNRDKLPVCPLPAPSRRPFGLAAPDQPGIAVSTSRTQ